MLRASSKPGTNYLEAPPKWLPTGPPSCWPCLDTTTLVKWQFILGLYMLEKSTVLWPLLQTHKLENSNKKYFFKKKVCIHVCVHDWYPCRVFLCHSPLILPDRVSHWTWNSLIWLSWLASGPRGFTCLIPQHWDEPCSQVEFLHGFWWWNPALRAASNLPTEPSPHPGNQHLLKHVVCQGLNNCQLSLKAIHIIWSSQRLSTTSKKTKIPVP